LFLEEDYPRNDSCLLIQDRYLKGKTHKLGIELQYFNSLVGTENIIYIYAQQHCPLFCLPMAHLNEKTPPFVSYTTANSA